MTSRQYGTRLRAPWERGVIIALRDIRDAIMFFIEYENKLDVRDTNSPLLDIIGPTHIFPVIREMTNPNSLEQFLSDGFSFVMQPVLLLSRMDCECNG